MSDTKSLEDEILSLKNQLIQAHSMEMKPSTTLDLIDGYLAMEKMEELEDILGITACGCGDVVSAVKTLKAENQRLRERVMEYEIASGSGRDSA